MRTVKKVAGMALGGALTAVAGAFARLPVWCVTAVLLACAAVGVYAVVVLLRLQASQDAREWFRATGSLEPLRGAGWTYRHLRRHAPEGRHRRGAP